MTKLLSLGSALLFITIDTAVLAAPKKTQLIPVNETKSGGGQLSNQSDDMPTKSEQPSPDGRKGTSRYHVDYSDFEKQGPALNLNAHRSPFEDLIDQGDVDSTYGARMARVDHPTFIANFIQATYDGESKSKGSKDEIKKKTNFWNVAAMTNTPIGLRVGAVVSGADPHAKYKITDTAETISGDVDQEKETKSIMVAAIIKEGLGLGLSFVDVNQKLNVDFADSKSPDESDHFGYILPTFYYANSTTEFVATVFRPMRHRTGVDVGYYDLKVEHQLESFDPIFSIKRNFGPASYDSENSRDNYELSVGGRFFFGKRSNIVAKLNWSDISYAQTSDASYGNISDSGITISGSFWLASQQCLGLIAEYGQGQGRTKDSGTTTKHRINTLALGANYGIRI